MFSRVEMERGHGNGRKWTVLCGSSLLPTTVVLALHGREKGGPGAWSDAPYIPTLPTTYDVGRMESMGVDKGCGTYLLTVPTYLRVFLSRRPFVVVVGSDGNGKTIGVGSSSSNGIKGIDSSRLGSAGSLHRIEGP
jgi:hypothetical protein